MHALSGIVDNSFHLEQSFCADLSKPIDSWICSEMFLKFHNIILPSSIENSPLLLLCDLLQSMYHLLLLVIRPKRICIKENQLYFPLQSKNIKALSNLFRFSLHPEVSSKSFFIQSYYEMKERRCIGFGAPAPTIGWWVKTPTYVCNKLTYVGTYITILSIYVEHIIQPTNCDLHP